MDLEEILNEGVNRGGKKLEPHKDGLPGLGYIAQFDLKELGRSGNEVKKHNYQSSHSIKLNHVDVIEETSFGHLHHRIYKPSSQD